jgi:hypothetical protein
MTCCKEAAEKLAELGFNATVDPLRIAKWNTWFRDNSNFPHPNVYIANGIEAKPEIFELFPQAAARVLGEFSDFANEPSQLEFVCSECGVEALITTKYHAEYAGEGIEYSWGAAKALYRQYPIYSKQGKENFLDLVSTAAPVYHHYK